MDKQVLGSVAYAGRAPEDHVHDEDGTEIGFTHDTVNRTHITSGLAREYRLLQLYGMVVTFYCSNCHHGASRRTRVESRVMTTRRHALLSIHPPASRSFMGGRL